MKPLLLSFAVLLAVPASAQDWTSIDLGTMVTLRAFEQRGNGGRYLVGDDGFAARSDASFTTWTPEDVGTTADLHSVVRALSGSASWISGSGGVVRMGDGTGTWSIRDLPDASQDYVLISPYISNDEVRAAGSGGSIWKTTDGGVNWAMQNSGTTTSLHAGFIVGVLPGYVVGDGGLILKSNPGGETWTPLPSGTTEDLYAIARIPPNESSYVVVGANGTILTTSDGGATWTPRASGTTATLRALSARTDLGAWLAVGDGGTVLRNASNFVWAWCTVETSVTTDLYAVLMLSASRYFVAGEDGVLLHTETNGGGCVAVANEPEVPPVGYALSAVWPNPARSEAMLTFRVDRSQHVRVDVLDVRGRAVLTAFAGAVAAGAVVPVSLDVRLLASGVYVVWVRSETFAQSRRMAVIR